MPESDESGRALRSAIVGTVEDLQAQTRIKTQRARQAVETTFDLLSFDLIEGSLWMDVRKAQDPKRGFGTAADGGLERLPPTRAAGQGAAPGIRNQPRTPAAEFLKSTAASSFYRAAANLRTALGRAARRFAGNVEMTKAADDRAFPRKRLPSHPFLGG